MDDPLTVKQKGLRCTSEVFVVRCGLNLDCDSICPTNFQTSLEILVHERHSQHFGAEVGWNHQNNLWFMCLFWTTVLLLKLVQILVWSNPCKYFFFLNPKSTNVCPKGTFWYRTLKFRLQRLWYHCDPKKGPENCCFSSLSWGHKEIDAKTL